MGSSWPAVEPKIVATFDFPKESSASLHISLTHLWAAENVLRLTTMNAEQLMQAVPWEDLSPTFRDAVLFTRRMKIQYLWIDSLCIVQDSPEDWLAESAVMNQVYKYSVCNIAATAASDGCLGLYQQRPPRTITPYRVCIQRKGHEQSYIYSLADGFWYTLLNARLNMRGWVFQERLLSPRTLHFSSQMLWECRMLHACETYPTGVPRKRFWESCKTWTRNARENDSSNWRMLSKDYCRTQLTNKTDRLAALAGLAQEMHLFTNDEYIAGLWKRDLPYALCWRLVAADWVNITRPVVYRCKNPPLAATRNEANRSPRSDVVLDFFRLSRERFSRMANG